MSSAFELHAFNQLHRIHQQAERDAAPRRKQRNADPLEAGELTCIYVAKHI